MTVPIKVNWLEIGVYFQVELRGILYKKWTAIIGLQIDTSCESLLLLSLKQKKL